MPGPATAVPLTLLVASPVAAAEWTSAPLPHDQGSGISTTVADVVDVVILSASLRSNAWALGTVGTRCWG